MELIYLASPYSHDCSRVRESRYEAACKAAAALMLQGKAVFSPIAHTHGIGIAMGRPVDHAFWMRQDIAILRRCERLVVLCLGGWDQSKGVNEEIHLAMRLGIPVEYRKYEDILDAIKAAA